MMHDWVDMMLGHRVRLLVCSLCLMVSGRVVAGPVVGQLDDSPAEQNWTIGGMGLAAVTVQNVGGPAGGDDAYLQYVSDASVIAGKMLLFNTDPRWTGDYLLSGVTAVEMDVRNAGATDLHLRLALGDGATSNLGSWFVSSNSTLVSPGSGWTKVTFPIAASEMTQVLGAATHSDVLSAVAQTRIVSSVAGLSNRGDLLQATIHVDNVRAIPEPSSLVYLGLIAIGMALIVRRCSIPVHEH